MAIVIVEDNPIFSDQLKVDLIDLYGEYYDPIYTADNISDAISLINEINPQIVFLDIKMDGDGKAGIKIAEKIKGKIPFVFVSGLPDIVGIQHAKHMLPAYYLRKPYSLDSLRDAVTLADAHSQNNYPIYNTKTNNEDQLIWVTSGRNKKEQINLKELVTLTVSDHYLYAQIINKERPIMFLSSLSDFQEKYLINNKLFFKLRNNLIVHIRFMDKMENNMLFMRGLPTSFSIPRNKKEPLLQLLDNLSAGSIENQ